LRSSVVPIRMPQSAGALLLVTSNPSLVVGGEGIFAKELAIRLLDSGLKVVLLRRDEKRIFRILVAQQLPLDTIVPRLYGLGRLLNMTLFVLAGSLYGLSVVKQKRVSVIHSHDTVFGGLVGLFLARITRRPLLITSHGSQALSASRLFRGGTRVLAVSIVAWMSRVCISGAASTVILDESLDAPLREFVGTQKRLEVIPTFPRQLSMKLSRESACRLLLVPTEKSTVGYVGRLSPEKNVKVLLKALALCPRNIHLLIIGDGSERGFLQRTARDLRLDQRVTFVGSRTDMENLWAAIDILVVPSHVEGLPQVVLEAWTLGVPLVVSSNVRLCKANEDALQFRANDPYGLRDAIVTLITDYELRQRLVKSGRERLKEFSASKVVHLMRSLYDQSLNRETDRQLCRKSLN